MEAAYGWVKNIIYYMIFLSVVNNLLADSKYGKYIRFFAGMVLILLVVNPFTGGLHLDEQISSMFRSISFENDTDDLKNDLWGMEERRLDQVISRYEDAVAEDIAVMAREEGLACFGAQVSINGDKDSSRYGQVEQIRLLLDGTEGRERGQDRQEQDHLRSRPVNVEAGRIGSVKVDAVELGETAKPGETVDQGETAKLGEAVESGETVDQGEAVEPGVTVEQAEGQGRRMERGHAGGETINHLTGKVAQYYGLEESDIEIQWKDD